MSSNNIPQDEDNQVEEDDQLEYMDEGPDEDPDTEDSDNDGEKTTTEEESNVLMDSPYKSKSASVDLGNSLSVIWDCDKIQQIGKRGTIQEGWKCQHCK